MSDEPPARTAAIIIASTRAAGGVYPDRTGPIIAEWLTARGFDVDSPIVVPDGPAVFAALRGAVGAGLSSTAGLAAEGAVPPGAEVGAPTPQSAQRGVADESPVSNADQSAVDLVITSGGTGISPTDRTPQATAEILDYEIPGLAAAIRAEGSDKVPTAVLSRGLAGVSGRTLVINLPGSSGGVRDGLAVLDRVLNHALDQLSGGDHRAGGGA